jgi:hypothetical protein
MIEPIAYWTPVISVFIVFVLTLRSLVDALEQLIKQIEKLEETMKRPPKLLKLLLKFLIYSLTLVLPNLGIIWYFFYLAGFSPYRLSELRFFLAIVAQPTIGVSVYAYFWGKWLYPQLQRILSEPALKKEVLGKGGSGHNKATLPQKSKSGQRSNH